MNKIRTIIRKEWLEVFKNRLVIFTVALGVSLHRGLDISCGCFSVAQEGERIAWQAIGRNLVLLFFGILLVFRHMKKDLAHANTKVS